MQGLHITQMPSPKPWHWSGWEITTR